MFVVIDDLARADALAKAGLLWYSAQYGSTLPYNYKPVGDTLPSACTNFFTFYILAEE